MLEVADLRAGYFRDLDVLRGVRLRARPAAVTAVLGANGVGKSTLLKAIYGFLTPTGGRVLLGEREITGTPPYRMIELGVAYMPQQPGVFAQMSVEENILVGAWTFRRDKPRTRQRLRESYERFPILGARRASQAGELSGGQRRMVELARALMTEPRFLLVDEPSAGLAPLVADEVYATLDGLRRAGVGIVLVDQDIPRALRIADYVYVIDLGTNRVEGTPAELGDVERTFWAWSLPQPGGVDPRST
jgi:branched-chain amino acid transport system ATP-binding protein